MSGKIFSVEKQDGIGVLTLNVPGEAMNTLSEAAVKDFAAAVKEVQEDKGLIGAIIISGKPDNFCAGANLKMIADLTSADEAKRVLDMFHQSYNAWSELKIPTLAAINGVCLGGGLELALACTARLATDAKATMIGLPECNVGVFPGAGGTQRLPRLIGYPAMDLILKGSLIPAAKALELGILDRLEPAGPDLLAKAKGFLSEIIDGRAQLKRPVQDFSKIDEAAAMARKGILKITKGRELPGPMLALKSMHEGLKVSLKEGLELEKKYFIETALSPEAKGSINTFFIKTLTDKPKGMMTKGFTPKPLKKMAVLGFGTMGRGIIIDVLRNTQIPVMVKDFPETFQAGRDFIRKVLEGMAEKKRLAAPVDEVMGRLTTTSEYGPEFKDVDLVIEAVFEDIKVKEQTFKELCQAVRDDCIIASNTSSLLVNKMAAFVTNPERFGGTHFFSPVWLMQLVEIVRSDTTSQDTVDNLLAFAAAIRKRPIVCRDNPGFVVNALLLPYFIDVLTCLEQGNTIEKIDGAMMAFGMPVGPIRLIDEVGIDVPYKVLVGMGIKQDTLKQVVEDGRLGLKKSGKGFFLKDGSIDPEVLPLIAKKPPKEVSAEEIQKGVLTAMVKVGKDLLDRNIVSDPRMIDVGMIWATGFPPDKGGPMKWADLTGLSRELYGKNFY